MAVATNIKAFTPSKICVAAICVLAAGCASGGSSLDRDGKSANYKDEIGVYSDPSADVANLDPVAAAAYWSVQYDKDPQDHEIAAKYSAALRKIGSVEQAVRVIVGASKKHGDEPVVALEAGKALIEAGRAFEAVRYIETAARANPEDWRTLSVLGVALDQIGEHEMAQNKYQMALTIAPHSVNILNNKGLSYAMSGDLDQAAQVLRAAVNRPGADARVRQNLALVLAIKGDMLEAERLARSDLPPQIADGNINYFRSLIVQPAYWQDFAADAVETPNFDAAPFAPAPQLSQPAPAAPTAPATTSVETKPTATRAAPTSYSAPEGGPEMLSPATNANEFDVMDMPITLDDEDEAQSPDLRKMDY